MEGSLGVRKGLWTEEEDDLLRKCVDKYGEEKWHQVPLRAGLNRCRKSCRLRWLNYLKPNIKRGEFEADEVDIIMRLHKLLGNRWSLIAGRLPGRTANDVKNYWNTHLRKKTVSCDKFIKENGRKTETVNIIRPRPRKLSKKIKWLKANLAIENTVQSKDNTPCNPSITLDPQDNKSVLWENLLAGKELDQAAYSSMASQEEEVMPMANLLEESSSKGTTKMEEYNIFYEVDQTLPTDLWLDVNLWNLFNTE